MPTTTHRRAPWRTVLVFTLTLALLWYFFKNVAFADVWRAVRQAHLGLIGAAIAATFLTYLFRTWRWQALLVPIGRARFRTAFRTTIIGFTATFLLPARIGEVLRPYLLARYEHFSFSATFATIFIERLLDLAAVLSLFGLFLLTADLSAMGRDLDVVKLAGGGAAAASLGALVTLFVCAGHPERLGRLAGRLTGWLPIRVAAFIAGFVRTFAEGLAVMRRPGPLVVAAALSIPMWVSIGLGVWLTSRAFDLTFALSGSFLIVMFLVVGVAIPTPGGAGTFELAYQYAVTHFFGAGQAQAVAAALVLHAVSFVPISIVGLLFMGQDGLTLAGLEGLRQTAQAAETTEERP
jgi:uncharacterized protein (TIRG00374 family)